MRIRYPADVLDVSSDRQPCQGTLGCNESRLGLRDTRFAIQFAYQQGDEDHQAVQCLSLQKVALDQTLAREAFGDSWPVCDIQASLCSSSGAVQH